MDCVKEVVMTVLEVLNPVAQQVQKKGASALRLAELDGKVIGLYWNHKPGGDAALKRTGELLKARFPGVETRIYVGSIGGTNRFMTKDDVQKISRECAAVVGSSAD
jgi:hypothetical protein